MKKLAIKIDRPCSEKWEAFEKRSDNGFCSSCQKEVVDFTRMSETEIKDYFLKSIGKDICGRMRKDQQREYLFASGLSIARLSTGLMTLGSLLLTSTSLQAQNTDQIEMVDSYKVKLDKGSKIISGTVTDDSDESLPGVHVVIKGTSRGTTTDIDGKYEIEVPVKATLTFSFVGFGTSEVKVGQRTTIDIAMDGAVELGGIGMGGIGTQWYTPRGLWWRTKGFFARIF